MHREKDIFDDFEDLMVEDARKTYSEKVMDHFMNPRNWGEMKNPDCYNVMSGICGDTIGIFVGLENNTINRISFITSGCGPTIACSSALTSMAEGLTVEGALQIKSQDLIDYLDGLPKENTHCADLAVNTLRSALRKLE
jgi:nitrogen fixation protein NifU and related proteins